MDKKPVIQYISRMLEDLDESDLRAVYMVVRQMYTSKRG